MKLSQKISIVFTFSLLSLNAQANNLVVNGDFTSNTDWVGLTGGGWSHHVSGAFTPQFSSYGSIFGALNQWGGPSNLTQDVTIANSGNYQFQWNYVAVQLGPYAGTTYAVSLGSSFSRDLIAPVSADNAFPLDQSSIVTTTNTYQVRLSQGVHRIIFGDDLDVNTNSPFFIINNVSLVYIGPYGPSTEDTLASMRPNAFALRGAYSIQSAIINTGLTYDCTTFDARGICVSAGGRVTDNNNPSTNSQGALLIASYRANEQWRVGAYLDQNLSSNDARGVNLDNNNPMGGVFAVWNQNTDGTGYQVRLASGYSDKDVTISRSAFGATGEAGKGDSSLQSQAYSATISRGFQLNNTRWIASPYLGVRYTKIKRAGYTEDSSADVTTPLTYSALSQETTTALAGVRFNGQLGDKINLMASVGIENDIAHNTGDYAATGVDGLTPIAFNQNIRHIRPVASAGASYAIDKRQTVGANLNFRQEAFNSTNSVSGMVTYQVGF